MANFEKSWFAARPRRGCNSSIPKPDPVDGSQEMSETLRAESQRVAEAAGFSFALPAATQSVIGVYRPIVPEFARMGVLAHYTRACLDLALGEHPHASATYGRCSDPIKYLCLTLARAELGGDAILVAHKMRTLERLITDVLAASRRDPDRLRQLWFAATLQFEIGRTFLEVGAKSRMTGGSLSGVLALLERASARFKQVITLVDAMQRFDRVAAAAE